MEVVEIYLLEYITYHLLKVISLLVGAVIFLVVASYIAGQFGKYFLGSTYLQFRHLSETIEVPPNSVVLIFNLTYQNSSKVLTEIGEECKNTICLCVLKFERIEWGEEVVKFLTKYQVRGSRVEINLNTTREGWRRMEKIGFVYGGEDYIPNTEEFLDMLNLNSDRFCRAYDKILYVVVEGRPKRLVSIVNDDLKKLLRLYVNYT